MMFVMMDSSCASAGGLEGHAFVPFRMVGPRRGNMANKPPIRRSMIRGPWILFEMGGLKTS